MKRSLFPLLLTLLFCTGALSATLRIDSFQSTGKGDTEAVSGIVTLLSSRLEGRGVTVVPKGEKAEYSLSGSYTKIGSNFSIDTLLQTGDGTRVGRSFVEGGEESLIPAVGTLAGKIADLVATRSPIPPAPAPAPAPLPAAPPVPTPPRGTQPVTPLDRIDGVMVGIAPFSFSPDGSMEFVTASARELRLYRRGEKLERLATLPVDRGSVLTLDSIDLDGDGSREICVTVMNQEMLASMIVDAKGGKLTPRITNLPWYFRVIDVPGGKPTLFGQTISSDEDYYGPVTELTLSGTALVPGKKLTLPKGVSIHRFALIPGVEGGIGVVVIDPDNTLRVYSPKGEELWQGNEKVGGSEVYFLRDEQQMQPLALDRYRWRFLEPRMLLASANELIVPKNSGIMVLGNSRSYSHSTLKRFVWNGATLVETGSTPESSAYLADWFIDPRDGSILTLEVVQRDGLFRKGGSAVARRTIQ